MDSDSSQDIPRKYCSGCEQWKLATPENFYRSKRDTFTTPCIECYKKKYAAKGSLKFLAHPPIEGMHYCHPCEQYHPATAEYFYISGKHFQCRIGHKAYQQSHTDSHRVADRKYRLLHPQRARQSSRDYGRTHREQRKLAYHRYVNTPYGRAKVRARYRPQNATRRALKRAAIGSYTPAHVQAQLKRQKNKCYWCNQKLQQYHVDHVIPLSRGGSNEPSNLVIACPTCNCRKGAKLPHEWIEGGRLL